MINHPDSMHESPKTQFDTVITRQELLAPRKRRYPWQPMTYFTGLVAAAGIGFFLANFIHHAPVYYNDPLTREIAQGSRSRWLEHPYNNTVYRITGPGGLHVEGKTFQETINRAAKGN